MYSKHFKVSELQDSTTQHFKVAMIPYYQTVISCENWTLMVGEGGGVAKFTKIVMAIFGHFMVNLYLNKGFNGLIDFFRFGLV